MHKKNKAKNKPKNPNPLPPQQAVVNQPVKEAEEEKEERVPEIAPELDNSSSTAEATPATAGPTPAKPKRHRAGKKRKQNDKQDNTEPVEICTSGLENVEESSGNKDALQKDFKKEEIEKDMPDSLPIQKTPEITLLQNPNIECIEEKAQITPTARKKKEKKAQYDKLIESAEKKLIESLKEETVVESTPLKQSRAEISLKQTLATENVDIQADSELFKNEQNSGKKKNKKNKKSSPDSLNKPEIDLPLLEEKSQPKQPEEKISVVECASELHLTKQINITEENKIKNVIPNELESKDDKSKLQEFDSGKNKKKNKKNKRSSSEQLQSDKSINVIMEETLPEPELANILQNESDKPTSIDPVDKTTSAANEDRSIKLESGLGNNKSENNKIKEKRNKREHNDQISKKPLSDDIQQTEHILSATVSGDNNNNLFVQEPIAEIAKPVMHSNSEIQASSSHELPLSEKVLETDLRCSISSVPLKSHSELNKVAKCMKPSVATSLPEKNMSPEITRKEIPPSDVKQRLEEEFLVRLFEKPVVESSHKESFTQKKITKPETTDLKGKVMEVNKDMEDLKLSIEKSLAELTSMEEDDMPELVAITECITPQLEVKTAEAISVHNVESQILPEEHIILQSATKENVKITDNVPITMETSVPNMEINKLEAEECKDVLIEPHNKKHKGKGKSGTTIQEPIIISAPKMKDEPSVNPRDVRKITEKVKTDYPASIGPIVPQSDSSSVPQQIEEIDKELECCNQEHKGKGKGKNKKKGKMEPQVRPNTTYQETASSQSANTEGSQKTETSKASNSEKNESKSSEKQKDDTEGPIADGTDNKSINTDALFGDDTRIDDSKGKIDQGLDNIDNFEDAMTSSLDDVNNVFEVIVSENNESSSFVIPIENDGMTCTTQAEATDTKEAEDSKAKENPLSTRSKNLLGHPDIPVTSNKTDYKKEKNKNVVTPNAKQARIKVKDSVELETKENSNKCSTQSQTENKIKTKRSDKNSSPDSDNEEEYLYKYSFRKVFLTNSCHVCKAELKASRLACGYCNLIFYCGQKHKDEDWTQHQALCFAVSTIVHLKGLKFIYADAAGVGGQDYRLLRMQVIVSCEKILKRKLLPSEQEALLYPRVCSDITCREWRSGCLSDCEGCGLVAYCTDKPQHLTKDHQTWCKSYRLYYKLVTHQQSIGRLEPRLPSKVIEDAAFRIPDKMNELLARLYEGKIELDDVHYAALTQLATAPLTAAWSHQLSAPAATDSVNGHQNKIFTLHVVGAELQFEADTLSKWEVFFLHLRPDVQELRVVFVGPELNPSKLPLELLSKIKMCRQCRQDKRRIHFEYQDGKLYHDYAASSLYTRPDIVCAFNPGLHRTTGFAGADSWPETINAILRRGGPFSVTSYTEHELPRDLQRIRDCSRHRFTVTLEPSLNPYASVRPDRNFISDDEMPLIFKNYYLMFRSARRENLQDGGAALERYMTTRMSMVCPRPEDARAVPSETVDK